MDENQQVNAVKVVKARKIIFFQLASIPLLAAILCVFVRLVKQTPAVIIIETAAGTLIFIAAVNLILNILSIVSGKNLSFPIRTNFMLTHMLLPSSLLIGRALFSKDVLHKSFITYSNKVVSSKNAKFKGHEILVLLPRCIQNADCKNAVIKDILKCASCGKCDVAEINKLIAGTGIKAAVVTGGTQARALLTELHPKAVIAVACERELVSGIIDSNMVYVYGLLNVRPNGPCYNTRAYMPDLKSTIDSILSK